MNECELIQASLEGETERFGELVTTYLNPIFRFHLRLTGDHTSAEDLTQETFITAYRSLAKLEDHDRFRSWLYGIARHLAMNYTMRVARWEPDRLDPSDFNQWPAPRPDYSALEMNERMAAVDAAINTLPDDLRTPLLMVAIEQLSYEETANVLELPLGTVKSRIARARACLINRLSASDD